MLDELTKYLNKIKQQIQKRTLVTQNHNGVHYSTAGTLGLLVAWGRIYQYPLQDKIPIVGLVLAGTLAGALAGKLVGQWRGTWISVSAMNKRKVKGKAIIKKHST